jgi:Flp pilus assembly protein TadG
VVEFAVLLPLLAVLTLGAIDVGQLANVAQTISEASREGARLAARNVTTNVSEVEDFVRDYVSNSYPGIPEDTLDSSLTIRVTDSSGNAISGGALDSVAQSEPIFVEVELPFDAVRWFQGISFGNNRILATTTMARRE